MAAERCCSATAAVLLAAALAPGARAAAPPPPAHTRQQVQIGLLEFLGESDPTDHASKSDGARWMVYLSQLNLATPAPPRAPAKTKTPAARPPVKHKASS